MLSPGGKSKKTHPLQDAFDDCYDGLYRFIYSRTFNSHWAEDLASQTFLKAVENWDKYDSGKGKITTWLFAIAKNLVTDYFKSSAKKKTVDDVWDFADTDDFVHEVEQMELYEKVKEAMEDLSADQRQVVILRIWHDMPYSEIAEVMGKSEASLKMAYSRAIGNLKDKAGSILLVLFLSGE